MPILFFADDMAYTPFDSKIRSQSLASVSLEHTSAPEEADIIVSRILPTLSRYFYLGKRYYVWTHEPRWMPTNHKFIIDISSGNKICVSSAYNGDIYLSPLFYFPFMMLDLDEIIGKFRLKQRKCVFLSTYRSMADRFVGDSNVDLSDFRQRAAVSMQQAGVCDIYGKSWPAHIKTEGESRGPGWQTAKTGILDNYKFNLACENTATHNYITEKFWDAVRSGSVPIYLSRGTGIDQVTDPGSFLDCSDLSVEAIVDKIETLGEAELEDMIVRAVTKFNQVSRGHDRNEVRQQVVRRFRDRVLETLG